MAKKIRKKREKHVVGPKEMIFDVVSILAIVLFIGFIGFRSIKYYSKERAKNKVEANTLFRAITTDNKITKGETGLRQTEDGYYFIGNVENNYVKAFNRLYRIVDINKNNEIKIVSNGNEAVFTYGDDNGYLTSNVYNWLNKVDNVPSGVYYNTIPGVEKLLTKTSYKIATFDNNKIEYKDKKNYKDYFSILSISDYTRALGTKSYLKNGSFSFILGDDVNGNPLYLTEDGTVDVASSYDGYGVRVVMTLKKNILINGGKGTIDDPYILNQEDNDNEVNKYFKLGDDVYQAVQQVDNILRLKKTDFAMINGSYLEVPFSNYSSEFDYNERNNIANYLNSAYLNSLPYAGNLVDCELYTGEISSDTSYSMSEIFTNMVYYKVGLLNQFDLNTDSNLTDYYLINKTSSVGNMLKTYNKMGILDDEKGNTIKKIVPVICIDKNIFKNGNGSLDNPYVME